MIVEIDEKIKCSNLSFKHKSKRILKVSEVVQFADIHLLPVIVD